MDFTLTEQQQMFRDSVSAFARKELAAGALERAHTPVIAGQVLTVSDTFFSKEKRVTRDFLPTKQPVKIVLTSGASCPDTLVDRVMIRLLDFFPDAKPVESLLAVW